MRNPMFRTIREGVPPNSIAVYPPGQADKAIPNGSRVRKINSNPKDGHKDGDMGTVLASHFIKGIYMYFVSWDDRPTMPVGITGDRVEHHG